MISKELEDMIKSSDEEIVSLGINILYKQGLDLNQIRFLVSFHNNNNILSIKEDNGYLVVTNEFDLGMINLWTMKRRTNVPLMKMTLDNTIYKI